MTTNIHVGGEATFEFRHTEKTGHYARCISQSETKWELETLNGPGSGSILLLRVFREARELGVTKITLNARTNDESLNTQEALEDWYRKFGFETIYRGVNGTKMQALVSNNRPLIFRIQEFRNRVATLLM